MHLAEIQIKNFRQFDDEGVTVELLPGLTALVGPNDSGKTAIIDAVRYTLSTTDNEYIPVRDDDFHISRDGTVSKEFSILCRFENFTPEQQAAFLEYLSITEEGDPVLYVAYRAERNSGTVRRKWNRSIVRSGRAGEGPAISLEARELLATAYLRPLRDAERELAPGRRSRLSQVLQEVSGIKEGESFDANRPPQNHEDSTKLSLEGLVEYLHTLVSNHAVIDKAKDDINTQFLSELSLIGDDLAADISFVSGTTPESRLRHILERLELNLINSSSTDHRGRHGLGSLNLLYMACELLLTEKDTVGAPLLLIEEPEAHLHPQRQLQLSSFLAQQSRKDDSPVQVLLSTHSPVLASKIRVENLVLVTKNGVRSLRQQNTKLTSPDYRFLHRFLDSTKANLFFARGVILVEGDAEQLLLPTLASLIGRDLTEHGVSIVNVGSTAHARYARVFQSPATEENYSTDRTNSSASFMPPVAVLRDRDIMPHDAATKLGFVDGDSDPKWQSARRKWLTDRDLSFLDENSEKSPDEQFAEAIQDILDKYKELEGQSVEVFISDQWTLEYDLCISGLAREVYIAMQLAKKDAKAGPVELFGSDQSEVKSDDTDQDGSPLNKNIESFSKEFDTSYSNPRSIETAIEIYKEFHNGNASKAITAQYLCEVLQHKYRSDRMGSSTMRRVLPSYLVGSIDYVTEGVINVSRH